MMKKIFFLLAFLVLAFTGKAQSENAKYECMYRLTFQQDTTQQLCVDALMTLRVGENTSLFYAQANFESDSLIANTSNYEEAQAVIKQIRDKYGRAYAKYYILKDFKKQSLDYTESMVTNYIYTEELPTFDWHFSEEKKQIGNYECQKATCRYMGRCYEVWFTPDIPINDGPWKFHGLPGLILEAYDTQHHYEFNFLGMNECTGDIKLPEKEYSKTTKKKFISIKQLSIDDPNSFVKGIEATLGIKSSSKIPKRKFYATMERQEAFSKN